MAMDPRNSLAVWLRVRQNKEFAYLLFEKICCTPATSSAPVERVFAVYGTAAQALGYSYLQQESRAAARKPRDAASVLFGRKPRFRAPNMPAQNTI